MPTRGGADVETPQDPKVPTPGREIGRVARVAEDGSLATVELRFPRAPA